MDSELLRAVLLPLAASSASVAGYFGACEAHGAFRRRQLRRRAVGFQVGQGRRFAAEGLWAELLRYMTTLSRKMSLGATAGILPEPIPLGWFEGVVRKTGFQEDVSIRAFEEASIRLAALGLVAGFAFGLLFSAELAIAGGLGFSLLGLCLPRMALSQQVSMRAQALEKELPELLEVTALGLRSGLSFDRSFALYAQHFDTAFAQECARVQSSWSLGLTTRDEALRDLAASYDSTSFNRVVETMIRSLRFGSSLGKELEQAAEEARSTRRSSREEVAAKAPVKMMIPTGVLILPAMLLMVLGPVLLEMMNGF